MTTVMNADALSVVCNPHQFCASTGLRISAWAILMGERGKRINQFRLIQMQRNLPAITMLTGIALPRAGSANHGSAA